MEQRDLLDTLLVCGVPVLQWRGVMSRGVIHSWQQILQILARNGYREIVLDLQQAIVRDAREWQRLLSVLEKMLPARTHAEVVLPSGSLPALHLKRLRIAPSVALALSHITRLPAAGLQVALTTHVRWHEIRDEE